MFGTGSKVSDNRFWAYVTAFGALWGFGEVTLGSFLMSLRLPFAGVVLCAMGTIILVAQRRLFPVKGATLATGIVASLCKSISPGGILIQPMVAIVMEAALAEMVFTLIPTLWISGSIAGVLGGMWTVFQQILVQYLIYGMKLIELYLKILDKASNWVGLSKEQSWLVLSVFLFVILCIGAIGGLIGNKLGQDALKMLGHSNTAKEKG